MKYLYRIVLIEKCDIERFVGKIILNRMLNRLVDTEWEREGGMS